MFGPFSPQIVKYFGFVISFLCASIYAFVVATSSKLHDMFHLLRMNVAIAYVMGNLVMMVAQDESYCVGIEARHDNILLSALQQ